MESGEEQEEEEWGEGQGRRQASKLKAARAEADMLGLGRLKKKTDIVVCVVCRIRAGADMLWAREVCLHRYIGVCRVVCRTRAEADMLGLARYA